MIFPGHVAAAGLVSRALGTDMRATLAVSMFPDVVDKPVRWVFRLTPNDRIPAHTLLGWVCTSSLVRLLCGPRAAWGWFVGYGTHLACDELNAHLNPGRIYFLWPFRRYRMHIGPTGLTSSIHDFSPASIVIEATLTVLALSVWWAGARDQGRGRESAQADEAN